MGKVLLFGSRMMIVKQASSRIMLFYNILWMEKKQQSSGNKMTIFNMRIITRFVQNMLLSH